MRKKFFSLLKERMYQDNSLFLLVADQGLGLVEDIEREFPDRFLNAGIAEQNMIGVAAGLCNAGFRPFCYTICDFIVHRCFEQIRNDICLHNYPITLVGTSTGFDNGLLGPTHQVIDDLGCIKSLPNMTIYSPSTVNSTRMVFEEIINKRQPVYLRLGKSSFDLGTPEICLNQFAKIDSEPNLLVITHGTMLENCIKAAKINNSFSIYCMNKIKPLNRRELEALFKRFAKIIVVEDHFVTSGLYNSLCQILVEMGCQTQLCSIGVPEKYEERVGDKEYFADKYGYSPEKIARFISEVVPMQSKLEEAREKIRKQAIKGGE